MALNMRRKNKGKPKLTCAPDRNDFEFQGQTYSVDVSKTIARLMKQYEYTQFFESTIQEAVGQARKFGIQGLIVATRKVGDEVIIDDFAVIDKYGMPLDDIIIFKGQDTQLKNQCRKYNSSNDQKLRIANGRKRAETFRLYAQGVKVNNKIFG